MEIKGETKRNWSRRGRLVVPYRDGSRSCSGNHVLAQRDGSEVVRAVTDARAPALLRSRFGLPRGPCLQDRRAVHPFPGCHPSRDGPPAVAPLPRIASGEAPSLPFFHRKASFVL